MIWIAPPEKDTDNAALKKRLWEALVQFHAFPGLKVQECFTPVPGLSVLRCVEVRYIAQRSKLEKVGATFKLCSLLNESNDNPPFNVNAVDKERLKDYVGPCRHCLVCLPLAANVKSALRSGNYVNA